LYDIAAGPHLGSRFDGRGGTEIFKKQYLNSGYSSFAEVVLQFLKDSQIERRPHAACFAVAGPVSSNVVVLTNIKQWVIDGYELQTTLQIPTVRIINDFSGIGYGLLTLEDSETELLNKGEHKPYAPILCIGAGTGLGECFLTSRPGVDGDQYEVFATEGGHVDFSPHGELQAELAAFIARKYDLVSHGRISVERVVSGQGIADAYEFLRARHPEQADKATSDAFDVANKDTKPAVVNNSAASNLCQLASRAVAIFLEAYGSEVGNCALKYLPAGGIYIAGGLMPRFLDRLDKSDFKSAFLNKGRMSELVKTMPLKVVKDGDIGLRGAKLCAARELLTLGKRAEDEQMLSFARRFSAPSIVTPLVPVTAESPTVPKQDDVIQIKAHTVRIAVVVLGAVLAAASLAVVWTRPASSPAQSSSPSAGVPPRLLSGGARLL